METQSPATVTYDTDRPFYLNGTLRGSMQTTVTINLNGPITGGGITFRGTVTFNIPGFIPSSVNGSVGRTDGGGFSFFIR